MQAGSISAGKPPEVVGGQRMEYLQSQLFGLNVGESFVQEEILQQYFR
jgi:hypothetical protein